MQTAADVLKHALYNEVKAGAFYTKAADITRDDTSRMLLLELAGLEDNHALSLLKRAEGAPCTESFDPRGYLKELEADAAKTISVEENEILKNGDMRTILIFAIGLETEAKNTYLDLADKAVDAEMRKFCKDLAGEEENHARELTQLLQSIDMNEEDRPAL